MRVSPSALERYRRCPRSFLLIDVERHRRREVPTGPLIMGSAVHAALERFYGLPIESRTPDAAELALRHVWPRYRGEGAFLNRHEEAFYGRRAISLLRGHAGSSRVDVEVYARECWASARLTKSIEVFGKIDRVDRAAGGGLRIVDYKTGRLDLDTRDMPNESSVQVYVVGAEQTLGAVVEAVSFIYLDEGVEVCWEPERDDVDDLAARLVQRAETIGADTEFEAIPGSHCDFCPVSAHCPTRMGVVLDDLRAEEVFPF